MPKSGKTRLASRSARKVCCLPPTTPTCPCHQFMQNTFASGKCRSLLLRPHSYLPILFNLDMDDIRSATDRAILHVCLALARRQIERNDDLFATRIANVAGFGLHGEIISVGNRRTKFLSCAGPIHSEYWPAAVSADRSPGNQSCSTASRCGACRPLAVVVVWSAHEIPP